MEFTGLIFIRRKRKKALQNSYSRCICPSNSIDTLIRKKKVSTISIHLSLGTSSAYIIYI